MGVIIFFPEAEFRLLFQAVQDFVLQNNKDLVCRSLKEELVTVFLNADFIAAAQSRADSPI